MCDQITNESIEKRVNVLMKYVNKTDNVRKLNQNISKALKIKLNQSIERVINELRNKQSKLNESIDDIVDGQNSKILSIEYEINQILGNLSTFMIINGNNDRSLAFIPANLDKRIDNIDDRVCEISSKNEYINMLYTIDQTIESIEKSFDVFDNEKMKLNEFNLNSNFNNFDVKPVNKSMEGVFNKYFINYDYKDWLLKSPVNNETAVTGEDIDIIDENDDTEVVNKDYLDCDSIEILHDTSQNIDSSYNEEFNLNKSTITNSLRLESSLVSFNNKFESVITSQYLQQQQQQQENQKQQQESRSNYDNLIQSTEYSNGWSKGWNEILAKPNSYWLAK